MQNLGNAFVAQPAAALLRFLQLGGRLHLGRLGDNQLRIELGELLARDAAGAAGAAAFVQPIQAAVVLDCLIGQADGVAQFADAIHQEFVDALHGLDLLATLMFEIALGKGIGDGGCGIGIRRLRVDAEDMRTSQHRDVEARQNAGDHGVVALLRGGRSRRVELEAERVQPSEQAGRQKLRHALNIVQRRRQFRVEIWVLCQVEPIDHLAGDVSRLQDEGFALDALRVGADIGDERLDIERPRPLNTDEQACLGNI